MGGALNGVGVDGVGVIFPLFYAFREGGNRDLVMGF